MKNFNYDLYQKSFPKINRTCTFMPNDSDKNVSISFKFLTEITAESKHMVYWVKFLKYSFVVMLWMTAIEVTMTWMHANDALPFFALDKIVLVRRIISIALQLFTFIYI